MIRCTVDTPDGPFTVVVVGEAVAGSGWTADADFFVTRFRVKDAPEVPASLRVLDQALAAVDAYYRGDGRPAVEVPLSQAETPFQARVRRAMRAIGYGERRSYAALAVAAGSPLAARAAASVCARNHTALFMPCHRVVRGDGDLGGFLYGLELKQRLLDREGGLSL